jgi:hypothetical protein
MNIIIRTKSGKEYKIPIPEKEFITKTPEEVIDAYWNAFTWSTLDTLRLGSYIFYTREIESFSCE